jgi:hypothetical protein
VKDIQRYEAQYGPIIDGDVSMPHLRQWPTGIAVLYNDYVKDVNERLHEVLLEMASYGIGTESNFPQLTRFVLKLKVKA